MPKSSGESVLFIAPFPFFQRRGSPIRVRHDLEALSELGYRIDLVTVPLGDPIEIPAVTIHRAANPFRIRQMPIGPSWQKIVFAPFLLARASSLSGRREFAFIHCVEDAGAVGWFVRKLRGGHLVFEKHSNVSSYAGGSLLRRLVILAYRMVEGFVMRSADLVFAGPNVIAEVQERAPETSVHLVTSIPSSRVEPDPARVSRIRAELGGDERVLLTFVGSFAPYQGVDILFDAMAAIWPEHPEARFIIIGGSDREIRDRRQWLARRGAEGAATFLGTTHPDETPSYLAASDVLLSPRTGGPNPTKIFDYLKVGRAIVATDLPMNRNLLDETTSVLTPATADGFADGIRVLLEDPERREALGARGAKLVAEHYSFEIFRDSMAEGYRRLVRPD
jgi:glycosyltransferase involved in cell wall biosynthesis